MTLAPVREKTELDDLVLTPDGVARTSAGVSRTYVVAVSVTRARPRVLSVQVWELVDSKAEWDYATSPYSSMRGDPISFADPDGEFITWSIHGGGFSIGVNLSPIGIGGGGGINIGWKGGLSVGLYDEVGYRFGGKGLGTGVTALQSVDWNLKTNKVSKTSSVGAFASFLIFNAGVNGAATLARKSRPNYNYGIGAGAGFGDPQSGVGLFIGYGSQGFNVGLGGYFDPEAIVSGTQNFVLGDRKKDEFTAIPTTDNPNGAYNDSRTIDFFGNSKITPSYNQKEGNYSYSMDLPKGHK